MPITYTITIEPGEDYNGNQQPRQDHWLFRDLTLEEAKRLVRIPNPIVKPKIEKRGQHDHYGSLVS